MCAISVPDWKRGPVLTPSCGAIFASRTALAVPESCTVAVILLVKEWRGPFVSDAGNSTSPDHVCSPICKRGSAECLAPYLDHVPPLDTIHFQPTKEDVVTRKTKNVWNLLTFMQ